jgi:site-specific DNA recombinase
MQVTDGLPCARILDALPTIALHPGLAHQYRKAIKQLHEELADAEARKEAALRLRKLIARIVVTPSAGKRGVDLDVIRRIYEVLALAQTRRSA